MPRKALAAAPKALDDPEQRRSPTWRGRLVRVGVVLGVLFLGYRLQRSLDFSALGRALTGARGGWIAIAVLCNLPLVGTKALRARTLLAKAARLSFVDLAGLYVTSYAVDNLVMSQAGLPLRVGVLGARGVPLPTALGAQLLEKVLEGVTLLALVPFAPLEALAGRLPPRLLALWSEPSMPSAVLVGLAVFVGLLLRGMARRSARLAEALAAAKVLRAPGSAVACISLSLAGWVIEVAVAGAAMVAVGLSFDLGAACLVVLAVSYAALIPGLPGNLGTFEAACVLALGSVGTGPAEALAFALVYHAAHTLPVTLLGLPGLRYARRLARPQSGSSEKDRTRTRASSV